MTTLEILQLLQRDIHSTVVATVDEEGLPQTCVIDMMLCDEGGLYFLTARGKKFYERLMQRRFVALSGMKGEDTMSTVSVSLRGRVKNLGKERLEEIFEKNSYMAKIYPSAESREALEVFQIVAARGELFDLRKNPVFRQSFSYGGAQEEKSGYRIDKAVCIGCGSCFTVCPASCIRGEGSMEIDQSRCLHCGNCQRVCPEKAVQKL